MIDHQTLQGINMPSDRPMQAIPSQIMNVVQSGIHHRLAGQQVVATIANVSAVIVENDSEIGYGFKKIEV